MQWPEFFSSLRSHAMTWYLAAAVIRQRLY